MIEEPLEISRATLGRIARRARHRLTSKHTLASRAALVPAVVETLMAKHVVPPDGWISRGSRWSDTGVAIIPIGPPGEPARLIVKFADSRLSIDALRAQESRLAQLHADARVADWAAIAPRVVDEGSIDAVRYYVETALVGVPATQLIGDPRLRRRLLPVAAEIIAGLHERTAVPIRVDDAVLDGWIGVPVLAIGQALQGRRRTGVEMRTALQHLGDDLRAELTSRELPVGWIHGDFWPGNLLVTANGSRVTGIVDWDLAADGQLASHDPVHLILQTRRLIAGREYGEVVGSVLRGDPLGADEQSGLAAAGIRPGPWKRESPHLVLLEWLRFVGQLAPVKSPHRGWVRRNIVAVLEALPDRRLMRRAPR